MDGVLMLGRCRSQSLTIKAGGNVNVLVPEVGTASDQVALASGYGGEAATDDLYMEGISIRRGFASEFIELLEVGGAARLRLRLRLRLSVASLLSVSQPTVTVPAVAHVAA